MMTIPKRYYTKNLTIALPVILSFAGQSIVQIVDTIMVGHLGAVPLAAVSLSCSIITNVAMIGTGIAIALTPLVGVQFVNNNNNEAGKLFQNSMLLNFAIGILSCLLLFIINKFLPLLGQPSEVLNELNGYYYWVTVSLIPYLVFLSFKQFLEGVGNTVVAMIITIGCNILNILLNFVFIYGYMGFPELGATGAGVATFVSRLLMPIVFYFTILSQKKYSSYLKAFSWAKTSLSKQWKIIKVGTPIATQMTLELFSLTLVTLMMGKLGAETLAANQIVQTMIGFSFMISNGVASASTILVSHSFGRKDITDIKRYTYSGIIIGICIMLCFAFLYAFGGRFISSIYTSDEAVINIATKLFIIVALFEIFDGIQVTSLGALRGLTEVKRPMYYAFISYIVIAIPVAYILAFYFDFGAQGILSGFIFGLISASFLFVRRFRKVVNILSENNL
jgi:MATE family multidrug resistance protein